MQKGIIVSINRSRGYGFIESDEDTKLFFHQRRLRDIRFRDLNIRDIPNYFAIKDVEKIREAYPASQGQRGRSPQIQQVNSLIKFI